MAAVLFNEITGLKICSRNTGYLLPAVLQHSIFMTTLIHASSGPSIIHCRALQAHSRACAVSVRHFRRCLPPTTELCTQTLKATQPNYAALPSAAPFVNVHADAGSVGAPRTKSYHCYCIPPPSARKLVIAITCTNNSKAISAGIVRLPDTGGMRNN